MRIFSTTTTTMNANSMMMTARVLDGGGAEQVSIKFWAKRAGRRDETSAAAPERAPAATLRAIDPRAVVHSEGAVDHRSCREALHGNRPSLISKWMVKRAARSFSNKITHSAGNREEKRREKETKRGGGHGVLL